ncbi:hypothetical protein H4R33_002584 [Dimargaris cristalligena]|nr:hypothetical protein H4R33_002584 [Dimargaris cristalligena]
MKAQTFQLDNSQSLVNKLGTDVVQLEEQVNGLLKEKQRWFGHATVGLVVPLSSLPLSPCSMSSSSSRDTLSDDTSETPVPMNPSGTGSNDETIQKVFEMKGRNQELQQEVISITQRRIDLQNTLSVIEEEYSYIKDRYCEAIGQISDLEMENRKLKRYIGSLASDPKGMEQSTTTRLPYDEVPLN